MPATYDTSEGSVAGGGSPDQSSTFTDPGGIAMEKYRAVAESELLVQCFQLGSARTDVRDHLKRIAYRLGRFIVTQLLDRETVIAELVKKCRQNGAAGHDDELVNQLVDLINETLDEAASEPMSAREQEALASSGGSAKANTPEVTTDVAPPLSARGLQAAFLALPYTDINDNETVVCYRSYFPAVSSAAY